MSKELSDFISSKNIVMDLNAKTKDEAIKQLSLILKKNGNVSDSDAFYKDVLKRESMTTTGIGNNIAIPHGKSSFVTDTTMLFAKNKVPLEWNSLDGSKVNIIFLMAVSPDAIGNASSSINEVIEDAELSLVFKHTFFMYSMQQHNDFKWCPTEKKTANRSNNNTLLFSHN